MLLRVLLIGFLLWPILAWSGQVQAQDRHAGYYYPPITSEEAYRARVPIMANASREMRIGFIVAQTNGQQQRKYAPRYAIFAKGDEAEKLIDLAIDVAGPIPALLDTRGTVLLNQGHAGKAVEEFRQAIVHALERDAYRRLCRELDERAP